MSGAVSIPDWPVGVNVKDFGAVPDDGKDDSKAAGSKAGLWKQIKCLKKSGLNFCPARYNNY